MREVGTVKVTGCSPWALLLAGALLALSLGPCAAAQPLCGEHVLRPPSWTVPAGQPAEVRATVEEVRLVGDRAEVDITVTPWPGRAQVHACVGASRDRCSSWGTHTDEPEASRRATLRPRIRWGPGDIITAEATHLRLGAGYSFNFALTGSTGFATLAPCALSHTPEWRRVRSTAYTFWRGYREDRWSGLPPGRYRATLRGERGPARLPGRRAQVSMVALVVGGRQKAALIYQQDSARWLLDRPGAGGVEVGRGPAVEGVVVELGDVGGELLVRWGFCCACAPAACSEGGWFTPPQGWEAAVVLERAR